MINGILKSKVEAIRNDFYNENKAQSSDVVNQLTMLMFIKMLDDKQKELEAKANILGVEPDQKDLTFKSGNYTNWEIVNDEKVKKFTIPYADLRWQNFKNLNSHDLAKRIKDYVIPFVCDPDNKAVGKFSEYTEEYSWGFGSKERLLANVVDKLSEVNPETNKDYFNFVDTDLMGDVYEYICGSGISGQFRTPRHIIDMAVEMMKPKIGEKIIDPAMGTAGFLIEAAKYIQLHQKDELLNTENKKKFTSQMFYGTDTDTNMARIGYMNCLLHDIKNPNITVDSLLESDNAKDMLGKFDVVLQNPPFSGAIPENTTNGKLLTICKTKKTEFLFVALMLQLMKIGGRGMSIVPDGVLFNSTSSSLINLRKELVDNQKLIGIVSMPNGLFQAPSKKGSSSKGSDVKTSFLIFERTDNGGTDYVWYFDLKNVGKSLDAKQEDIEGNEIPTLIELFGKLESLKKDYSKLSDKEKEEQRKNQWFFVPKEEIINNEYDLTFNKYKARKIEKIEYRSTNEIMNDIKNVQDISSSLFAELIEIFDKEELK